MKLAKPRPVVISNTSCRSSVGASKTISVSVQQTFSNEFGANAWIEFVQLQMQLLPISQDTKDEDDDEDDDGVASVPLLIAQKTAMKISCGTSLKTLCPRSGSILHWCGHFVLFDLVGLLGVATLSCV